MWLFLLFAIAGCHGIPAAECDVGSYKICFFALLKKIGAASDNINRLEAVVPKSRAVDIQASLPDFISYWTRSPKLTVVNDTDFDSLKNDEGLTVVIESPPHMSHSLQHAAATFSLMNSGPLLMPFPTGIKRVINVHPSHAEWAREAWPAFWWSFVDVVPVGNTNDLHNVHNVVVVQSMGPPFQSGNFFFSKVDAFEFRRRIYTRANVSLIPPARSRDQYTVCIASRSETRRIINLNELVKELDNNLHAMTLRTIIIRDPGRTYKNNPLELVRIVSTCDVFVAVHGSEFMLQMFMREKTAALEIMPQKRMELWHDELAYTLGINWVPVYPLHETKDDDYITWYGCQIQDTVTPACSFDRFHKNPGVDVHPRSLVKQIARQLRKIVPH